MCEICKLFDDFFKEIDLSMVMSTVGIKYYHSIW